MPPSASPSSPRVTVRAIILGAVLIPLNVYWITTVEGIWHTGHPTAVALHWNVVFTLLVLLGVNVLWRRLAPASALTQAEFVTVYVMLAIASALAGHDTLQLGVPNLSHGWWFANDANGWEKTFHRFLPHWVTVSDMRVLEPLYLGKTTLYTRERIEAWLWPALWWCAFIFAVGLVMVGINVILRRQWTEREKLGFPIVQLPLAMTEGGIGTKLFRNKAMWLGFAMGAVLDIYNGLHHFWPQIPLLDVRHDGGHFIDCGSWGRPWNAMGQIPLPFYPFCIALGFLLPLDLCFSIWFFFIVRKLQQVVASAAPIQLMPRMPYPNEQCFGAWFVLFGYAMWVGRTYFADIGRAIWTGRLSGDMDASDPLSHKGAVLAIVAGFAFIVYFCLKAGMSLACVVPFFIVAFVIHTAITRMRAELGPPAHEMAGGMNSPQLEVTVAGTQALGPHNLVMFPMFWWLTGRGYRTSPMPAQLEGFKMCESCGAEPQRLAVGIALAFALGGLFSFWSFLHLTYQHGDNPEIGHNWPQWNQMAGWMVYPQKPDIPGMIWIGLGSLFTIAMVMMRIRFVWWALHPAGYALSMNFGVEYFWTCLVVAWIIKWAILRYSGYKSHQAVIPVMYGIILGEYCVGAFWSAMSVILQQRMYDFCFG